MIKSTTNNKKEKVELKKKEIIELYLRKKTPNRLGDDTRVNLHRLRNEDTPEDQIEWMDKMGKYRIAYSPSKKMLP